MLKKVIFILPLLIFSFWLGILYGSNNKIIDKINVPIKKLVAEPVEGAKTVYNVPIEIVVTGKTKDFSWYRIKVSYNFLGYFEYEGWCKVN